jgi:sporulation protein YlmC with PRC-barrel domain
MAEATQFTIGVDVSCRDGDCGALIRVVVNPVTREVTHLVVEPKHREGLGRLVPLDLVEASADSVKLTCTLAEFEALDLAEETRFLPGSGLLPGYASSEVFALPYFGLGPGNVTPPVTVDALPLGEVAVRRGETVHAADGEIGRVEGLVIEPVHHHVTHFLLQEGHLWGRKEVAIPISAVTGIDKDGIRLSVTKKDVEDLSPVDVEDLIGSSPS